MPTGAWGLAKVPEGVLLRIGEKCGAFELLLKGIVDDLERGGVTGAFDLYELPQVPQPPSLVDLVEARLRVNGERVPYYNYRWAADREALWRIVGACARWCLANRPDRGVTLQVGTMPVLPVRRGDDQEALLRDGIESTENLGYVVLRSIGVQRFRSLAVEPSAGRVTLVDGGSAIHRDGWGDAVQGLADVIRATSSEAVYGFVKRGSFTHEAEAGTSLTRDWPSQSGQMRDGEAFEDGNVPDAFGMQLLGPGFTGRVPTGPDWRQTMLDGERVLLEHADLDAWLRGPRLGDVLRRVSQPSADLLARARTDFAAILFREEMAGEARSRRHELRLRRPDLHLPDQLAKKVAGFATPLIGAHRVALVLHDRRVVEDVYIAWSHLVVSVAGKEEFDLSEDEIADVLERS